MKKLDNVTTTITKNDSEKFTYADLLKAVINNAPQGGFTPEEMSKRLHVMAAVKDAKKDIELEDADVDTLKAAAKTMKWAFIHEELAEFSAAIAAL